MEEELEEAEGVPEEHTCERCGNFLYLDRTNRGLVWRCRNIQCAVDEVDV